MGFNEKLQPQIPISNLVALSKRNYEVAQSYYQQRRNAFKLFLSNNIQQASSIEEEVNKAIENIWNQNIFNIASNIQRSKQLSLNEKIKKIEQLNISDNTKLRLIQALRSGHPKNFYSALGFEFEQWLKDKAITPLLEQGNSFLNGHTEDLISVFTSGQLPSTSAVVSGSKNIRADLIINKGGKKSLSYNDKGALINSTGLPVELQNNLEIDWSQIIPNADSIMSDRTLLSQYLQPGLGDMYGFSVKSWGANQSNKPFMQSSVIQRMMNTTFNQQDSNGKRHSWEPEYTMEYVVYSISNKLFEIISPTTVALISRDGINWMDDFLSTKIFFMKVQLENYWKKRSGGLGRVYPQITDPSIYIRNYSISSASKISYRKNKNKQGNYITLKIS